MQFQFSLTELSSFAPNFWNHVDGAKVFAFHGQMGAGKTTIISALCHAKGTADPVASPTFSIINEYAYADGDGQKTIYHIDLYRLKDEEEVMQAGVEDCVSSGAICLIEWPEKAPHLFDDKTVHVYIEPISPNERRMEVKLPTALSPVSNNNRNL